MQACAGPGVIEALEARGAVVVPNGGGNGPADAVVVGYHRDFDYAGLTAAMRAVLAGARLIGTNDDATYPSDDGLLPGNGSLLAAVATASGTIPVVAGKPHEPMAALVQERLGPDGIVVGDRPELQERLAFLQNAVGAVAGPFDSFLALRGLKTLALRMERHCANAAAVAAWLERHPKVARVHYPGLASHPQHALAKRQMHGFGGMVTAILKGTIADSRRFLERCRIFALAESLGGVESLIEHPAIMTHASLPPETRAALGIGDGLVRLSVGVEDEADLIADLAQALA